jgi:hypothetical protein
MLLSRLTPLPASRATLRRPRLWIKKAVVLQRQRVNTKST